ncbi:hypothetical protein RB195_006649 [Necator americanus]|uniref:Uncharacterized protein n=1 Tax=Necator americanus TaxID=51031 RepID=A0ABR1BWB6_NECAM
MTILSVVYGFATLPYPRTRNRRFLSNLLCFSAKARVFPVSVLLTRWMFITRACRCIAGRTSQMRAWQVQSPAEPLQLQTVPLPVLTKPNQILIKVKVR